MSSKWTQNQQNPPLPKKKRMDIQGNARRRIFAKSGTATLLLVSGITQPGADAFISYMIENAKKLGGKCECEFRVCQ